ncbi:MULTISPECIES: alpha/beta hydrolase [unclassified Leptolyngbya]|uniref:alpha/beta hydrolase n=1 Tax=unclassified Leptolyngbya TaxID=2650499 RepID=UPI0016899438|nr:MULTISPECIES: alpha/beta hydrolase [unclassified Leptolyngbya]MBD1912174.1 alpha/beta hydrolase [Leptolyngbya sp. FACHB-8]MBD2155065.1 alpha/beta hydrolase [Leptolyngbya sp. FACHB-16]
MRASRPLLSTVLTRLARSVCWTGALALLVTLGAFGHSAPSLAAEEVVVTYGPLSASFPLRDLQTLARTGEPSQSLAFYLGIAGVDTATAQGALNTSMPLSETLLNDLMNGPTGDRLLARFTDVIHTGSGEDNIPALRSAIAQSTGSDQQITLLELMENYPTDQMYINGVNLMPLMEELSAMRTAR